MEAPLAPRSKLSERRDSTYSQRVDGRTSMTVQNSRVQHQKLESSVLGILRSVLSIYVLPDPASLTVATSSGSKANPN